MVLACSGCCYFVVVAVVDVVVAVVVVVVVLFFLTLRSEIYKCVNTYMCSFCNCYCCCYY